jgi:hypothetical protein
VSSVHHRRRNGRIVEIRRRYLGTPNSRVIAAAWRERSQGNAGREQPAFNREVSLAQLWARHARLLREAEQVKATVALMEREVG